MTSDSSLLFRYRGQLNARIVDAAGRERRRTPVLADSAASQAG